MQGELVLWRGESKGNEWKWKCRWEECLPATAAAARLPPPQHQCSALQLVFSILFPTRNKRQLLNCLLMKQILDLNVCDWNIHWVLSKVNRSNQKMGYLTITSTIKEDWIDDFSFYKYFVKSEWKSRKLIVCAEFHQPLSHSTWRTRELAAAAVQTSWVLLFLGACMRSSEASGNTC